MPSCSLSFLEKTQTLKHVSLYLPLRKQSIFGHILISCPEYLIRRCFIWTGGNSSADGPPDSKRTPHQTKRTISSPPKYGPLFSILKSQSCSFTSISLCAHIDCLQGGRVGGETTWTPPNCVDKYALFPLWVSKGNPSSFLFFFVFTHTILALRCFLDERQSSSRPPYSDLCRMTSAMAVAGPVTRVIHVVVQPFCILYRLDLPEALIKGHVGHPLCRNNVDSWETDLISCMFPVHYKASP